MSEKLPAFEQLRKSSEPPNFEEFGVPEEVINVFSESMGRWLIEDAHGFWIEPGKSDGHNNPDDVIVALGQRMHELSSAYNGNPFGSPIEEKLFAALLWLEIDWAGFPNTDQVGVFDQEFWPDGSSGLEYWISPQAKVRGYSVDIMLWFQCGKARGGIAIECDGHDFHEKTKEQAARDKKRDREIVSAGYPVMRFTGSEIYKSPRACAEQLREPLAEILFRVSKEGGLF